MVYFSLKKNPNFINLFTKIILFSKGMKVASFLKKIFIFEKLKILNNIIIIKIGTKTDRELAIGYGRGLQSVNILRN